jgi:signal transduction histidine kinase
LHYSNNPAEPGSLSNNTVIALLEDSHGVLWAGTNGGGLDRHDPGTRGFTHYQFSGKPGSISGDWVWSLFEDSRNQLWVGTWTRGLDKYVREENRFRTYLHDDADPNSLSNNSVLCIREDAAGVLWIGTHGGGLNRFDPESGRFTHFTEKEGLANNVVLGILPDGHGDLWLSTGKGISRFTPSTGRFRNFDSEDGLQWNEFAHGAFGLAESGTMLFGGEGGLLIFDPDSIRDNPVVPPLVLTGFRVFDRPRALTDPLFFTDRIILSHAENFFSFDFVALNYSSPGKNRYKYRLQGLDEGWVDAGSRRTAYYTHVPPGRFVFQVLGSNNDGVWNRTGAGIVVEVLPPYWEEWWFRLLLGLVVAATGVLGYRSHTRGLRREEQRQRELANQLLASQESERSRIAGELHDSLVQNLLVAKNRTLIGLKKCDDPAAVKKELGEISAVVAQSIDEVRDIAHNLRPYQIDRLGLTKAIRSLVETVSTASPIRFRADVEDIDPEIPGEKSIFVYRILQESLNNILRHSDASEASVRVRNLGGSVELTIRDNGKGFAVGKHDVQGSGLSGIAQRVRMLQGTLAIDAAPGRGVVLQVQIPGGQSR